MDMPVFSATLATNSDFLNVSAGAAFFAAAFLAAFFAAKRAVEVPTIVGVDLDTMLPLNADTPYPKLASNTTNTSNDDKVKLVDVMVNFRFSQKLKDI